MSQIRNLMSRMFPFTKDSLEGTNKLKSLSQKLLFGGRLVHQAYPGAYVLNPYLLRAVRKLEALIDSHMESIGGQRIAMPTLSSAELWRSTGRWENIGKELFTLEDRNGSEYCLAPTHEEVVSTLVAQSKLSYKNLPLILYQITSKFRDEPHPKHALLRSREFIMKDMYTFDEDIEKAEQTYCRVIDCYVRLFDALGLDTVKVRADTGTIGGRLSHEFHVESAVGEDTVYNCRSCGDAVNSELITDSIQDKTCSQPSCATGQYEMMKGIELGHAFLLGDKYSEPLQANYRGKDDKDRNLSMGCFGLGVTRIIAAALEVSSAHKQMRWPRVISPYKLVLIPQKKGYRHDEIFKLSEDIYDNLQNIPSLKGEIVIDDRTKLSIGARLKLAKFMGYPTAICLGKQILDSPPMFEFIDMYEDTTDYLTKDQLFDRVQHY